MASRRVFLWETEFGEILRIYCLVTVLSDADIIAAHNLKVAEIVEALSKRSSHGVFVLTDYG